MCCSIQSAIGQVIVGLIVNYKEKTNSNGYFHQIISNFRNKNPISFIKVANFHATTSKSL